MYASATNCSNTTTDNHLPQSQWINWCRLCAKEDNKNNTNVLHQNEEQLESGKKKLNLQEALNKYFGVQASSEDSLPKTICPDCLSLIYFLISFNECVERVQLLYHYLNDFRTIAINNSFDLSSVRMNYSVTEQSNNQSFFKYALSEETCMDTEYQYLETQESPHTSVGNDMLQVQIKLENDVKQQAVDPKDYKASDGTYSAEKRDEVPSKNSSDFYQEDYEDPSYSNEDESDKNNFSSEGDYKDSSYSNEKEDDNKLSSEAEFHTKDLQRDEVSSISKPEGSAIYDFKIDITCKECDENFSEVMTYIYHIEQAHNPQKSKKHWLCPLCSNRSYNMSNSLKRHIINVHVQKIKCPECEKCYKSNAEIEKHRRIRHNKEKQFICEECGLAVLNNRNLIKHMLRHTDVAPYECNICKNRFKDEERLKRHMRTHSSKRYTCNICGLQLKSKITYKNHLLVHSDIAQYKCDYCDKGFKIKRDLKHHLLVHIGLKPYSCDFCERTFSTAWNCNLHVKKTHPNEYAERKALGSKVITNNMPKFETLKAIANNLINNRDEAST